jgi:molecular chaperone GrpE (heat shock protein)
MTKEFPKEPLPDWPEEVKKAYQHLQIPSLYDGLLTTEKLGLEVRKQSKEMKALTDSVQTLSQQLDHLVQFLMEELEDDEDEDEEDEEFEEVFIEQKGSEESEELTDLEVELLQDRLEQYQRSMRTLLLETTDSLTDLSKSIKQSVHHLLQILPRKEGLFSREPAWHKGVEEVAQTLIEHVDSERYKLKMRLEDLDIQLIEPQVGDLFISQKHRAIEHVTGGPSGTIARVIRAGYMQENTILRCADVVVYI